MSNHPLFKSSLFSLRYWYWGLNALLFSVNLNGQTASYQYKIETGSQYSVSNAAVPIMVNKHEELAVVLRQLQIYEPHAVVRLYPDSNICQGYSYSLPDPAPGIPQLAFYSINDFKGRGDWAFVSGGKDIMTHLLALNLATGEYWCKKPFTDTFHDFLNFSFYENGDLIILNRIIQIQPSPISPDPSWMEVHRLDSLGGTLWKKGILFRESPQGDPLYDITCQNITTDQWGNMYLSGYIHGDMPGTGYDSHFLIKFDSFGNPLGWKKMVGMPFGIWVFTDGAIYLLDKQASEYRPTPDNRESAIIAKFDHDLNLLWLKKYKGENFPFYTANITESPSGGLYLSCVTYGAFPVILAELDVDGNIVDQKGYANYTPRTLLMNDGGLAISSNGSFDSLGNFVPYRVVAKTDEQGNIEGCVTLPTCLEMADTTVTFGTFHFEPHPVSELKDVPVDIQPISFDLTPHCSYPPAPIPDFAFPDTLCAGDSARTTDTHNRLANAHGWHLTGPGVDSVNVDSFDFGFRFLNEGQYVLKHTVWVLGCAYEHEREVVVLPGLEVEITPAYICPDGPFEVGAVGSRALTGHLWGTGDTSAVLPVAAPGIYSVQATDGHCTAGDTLDVQFLSDIIGADGPVGLPNDTTVCEAHLPYVLEIGNGFSDVFFINNDTVTGGGYALYRGGEYIVSTEIESCHFSETYKLEVDGCRASIYFPSVFSPNGDGINDALFPQGRDFEAISLQVYDRWGGLRYDGKGGAAAWSPGDGLAQGVYVYRFVYRNTLTGEVGSLSGDVVLVR